MTPSVLVVGAGSIGTRHARNLQAAGARVTVADPDRVRAAAIGGAAPVDMSVLRRLSEFDGVVIASPTSLHAEHVATALEANVPVLVEKPLARSLTEAGPAAASESVMVGFNLRFHEPLRTIRQLTASGRAGAIRRARFWMGSYLPDWRPDVDYRHSYSARHEAGGGILLDAIHELDLAVWWFGTEIEVLSAAVDRVSPLEIDVEDVVDATLRSPDGCLISVELDYLSRRYRRGVELIGDDATLRLDWSRNLIECETRDEVEAFDAAEPVAQSYEREAQHFLAWITGDAVPHVSGLEAAASLRLADEIRAVAS